MVLDFSVYQHVFPDLSSARRLRAVANHVLPASAKATTASDVKPPYTTSLMTGATPSSAVPASGATAGDSMAMSTFEVGELFGHDQYIEQPINTDIGRARSGQFVLGVPVRELDEIPAALDEMKEESETLEDAFQTERQKAAVQLMLESEPWVYASVPDLHDASVSRTTTAAQPQKPDKPPTDLLSRAREAMTTQQQYQASVGEKSRGPAARAVAVGVQEDGDYYEEDFSHLESLHLHQQDMPSAVAAAAVRRSLASAACPAARAAPPLPDDDQHKLHSAFSELGEFAAMPKQRMLREMRCEQQQRAGVEAEREPAPQAVAHAHALPPRWSEARLQQVHDAHLRELASSYPHLLHGEFDAEYEYDDTERKEGEGEDGAVPLPLLASLPKWSEGRVDRILLSHTHRLAAAARRERHREAKQAAEAAEAAETTERLSSINAAGAAAADGQRQQQRQRQKVGQGLPLPRWSQARLKELEVRALEYQEGTAELAEWQRRAAQRRGAQRQRHQHQHQHQHYDGFGVVVPPAYPPSSEANAGVKAEAWAETADADSDADAPIPLPRFGMDAEERRRLDAYLEAEVERVEWERRAAEAPRSRQGAAAAADWRFDGFGAVPVAPPRTSNL